MNYLFKRILMWICLIICMITGSILYIVDKFYFGTVGCLIVTALCISLAKHDWKVFKRKYLK